MSTATAMLKITMPEQDARKLADGLETTPGLEQSALGLWRAEDGLWTIEIFLPLDCNLVSLRKSIEDTAGALGLIKPEFEWIALDERNWVAEGLKQLRPIEAGRFFIHGSHDRAKRRAGGISIELEAAQAFGTGHHATTKLCLLNIDRILKQSLPHDMLDIGCGSGILAIAAAKSAHCHVIAGDIDPLSTQATALNARINQCAPEITPLCADGVNHPVIHRRKPFDLVTANILAGPLMTLASDIVPLLTPGGDLILSGLLSTQAPRLIARYRDLGLTLLTRTQLEEWACLHFTRKVRA